MKTYMDGVPELLAGIAAGRYALPDFQREFDWTEGEVADLIVTVVNDWPAGSLLLMEPRSDIFPAKPFEDGPDVADAEMLVLDGQQRLTAIFQACNALGPARYAFVISELLDGGDPEQSVQVFSHSEWLADLATPVQQFQEGLVPVSAVAESAAFFEWRDAVLSELGAGASTSAKEDLTRLYTEKLRQFERYRFPVVLLESDLEPVGIARVFERVNRLGQRLTTWDLMVARLYRSDWNLRQEWDLVQTEYPVIRDLCPEDGLPLLQGIALRYSGDVRQAAVLALRRELVHDQWSSFVSAMHQAGALLSQEHLGAESGLPYKVFRTIVSALGVSHDLGQQWSTLRAWLWGRTFSMHFDSAANTKAASDYSSLMNHIMGQGDLPQSVVSRLRLTQATRRSSRALWLGWHAWINVALERQGVLDADEGTTSHSLLIEYRNEAPPELHSPYHLRVLSQFVGPMPFVARLKRDGLAEAVASFESDRGRDWVNRLLEANYLPTERAGLVDLLGEPEQLIEYRVDRLLGDLAELGVAVEKVEGRSVH